MPGSSLTQRYPARARKCPSGASFGIGISFSPTATGTRTATVTIVSDCGASPDVLQVYWFGQSCHLAVVPTERCDTCSTSLRGNLAQPPKQTQSFPQF